MNSSSKMHNLYAKSVEDIQKIFDDSSSYCQVLDVLGIIPNGNNVNRLKKYIKEKNIDETSLEKNRKEHKRTINIRQKVESKDLFIENCKSATVSVKKRILDDKLLPYKCYSCGNEGEWLGKKLVLILDHINGVSNDNRLTNLRFVCPNCDSQSDTYKGRNVSWKKKKCKVCGNKLDRSNKSGYCKTCRCNNPSILKEVLDSISNRKLTDSMIEEILLNTTDSQTFLANKYNVSRRTIQRVKNNVLKWKSYFSSKN